MAERDDDQGIRDYVQEAQRLTTRGRNMRIATKSRRIGEKSVASGSAVVLMLVSFLIHYHPRPPTLIYGQRAGRGRARRQSCV